MKPACAAGTRPRASGTYKHTHHKNTETEGEQAARQAGRQEGRKAGRQAGRQTALSDGGETHITMGCCNRRRILLAGAVVGAVVAILGGVLIPVGNSIIEGTVEKVRCSVSPRVAG